MMNLEWYRIFLHTARHLNLTKAAQELHITQPSVSYAIKQLEEAMGLPLFHRLSKGVELTEEGRALLEYVEQSFAVLDSAQKHLRNLKQLSEGEIRIGASDSLIKHLLLPQLNALHRGYPGIRIRLSHGRTPDITQRLKEGVIDCALVHMPMDDPQLHIQTLAVLEDCFVVGDAYRELAGRTLSAEELAELPLILLSPGSSTRVFVEMWFAARGQAVKPDIELGSIDLLAEFAKLGYGAAFISRSFVQEELGEGTLFELKLEDPLPPRSIGFAVRRDRKLSAAADAFVWMLRAGQGPSGEKLTGP
ncbi:LysR family transcriptional regulator [Paenibacillus caseinilyticus]|uniref:LysR family transcriptional regulator n=1 Tax=Paenibacillus mucilaginosus K02 TaxID=997761 RepID=I0BGM2_9BACL|nr:LysR family transcriptional regulator [Paenibacillus mucilaginosus]AFH61519.1 LysR family transcriptional regulator [Paenibacillus mucilaginosus K02]